MHFYKPPVGGDLYLAGNVRAYLPASSLVARSRDVSDRMTGSLKARWGSEHGLRRRSTTVPVLLPSELNGRWIKLSS